MTSTSKGELPVPRCILPGCGNTAEEQGLPCGECAAAFGAGWSKLGFEPCLLMPDASKWCCEPL